jgi:hypothetical protein
LYSGRKEIKKRAIVGLAEFHPCGLEEIEHAPSPSLAPLYII